MCFPPGGHQGEHGNERPPVRCESVFHALQFLSNNLPRDDLFSLEFAQLFGQDFPARLSNVPEQLTETKRSGFQLVNDHRFPLPVNYVGCCSDRAIQEPHFAPSYKKVRTRRRRQFVSNRLGHLFGSPRKNYKRRPKLQDAAAVLRQCGLGRTLQLARRYLTRKLGGDSWLLNTRDTKSTARAALLLRKTTETPVKLSRLRAIACHTSCRTARKTRITTLCASSGTLKTGISRDSAPVRSSRHSSPSCSRT